MGPRMSAGDSGHSHASRGKATPAPPVIHIVDDDELVRASLASLFRSVSLETRLHASTTDFLKADRLDAPGCLVLDVRLPGASGLDLQATLGQHGITLPVILMTGHGDIPMSVKAMKAGAIDFLTKPFRDQDMLDAVSIALERDRQQRETHASVSEMRKNYDQLSQRERQVMSLVTAGLMNKQVAAELDLSEITVKVYRASAMKKMGAHSLAEWISMAQKLRDAS